ncbi:MAG TPA: hypothetical protein VL422_03950, partial [Miltoncostaea sp.]|nr:hypothetical protein [Miltoncostaea sp.]
MDLDEYRAEAEEHLRSPGPAADARHAGLFAAERVTDLTALAASGDTRMRNLARYAAEGHLRLASADEMARLERELRAAIADDLSLMNVDSALSAAASRDRRRELQGARLSAIGALVGAAHDVSFRRSMAAS